MNVCLVHIRLSVAPGCAIPDLHFKSDLEKEEDTLEKVSFATLADFHASTLAGMDSTSISPMKPSKTKAEQPEGIDIKRMSDAERNDIANKMMGRREFREYHVETYDKVEDQINNEDEEQSTSTKDEKRDTQAEGGARNEQQGRNIQDVISQTTRELLKRSSNSISSTKDDTELSEILQMSASVAAATGSRPSSSTSVSRMSSMSMGGSDGQRVVSPAIQTSSMPFFCGNPAVEITHGIIHLYKTNYMVQLKDEVRPPPTNTLCMLAVPATVDAHSILEFTSGVCDTIKRLQIIRDRTPNQYMVLLFFSSKKAAANFYRTHNDTQFSSFSPDLCHLAFIASVEALPTLHDTTKPTSGVKGLMPIPDSTELPDCVLCLERMDESVRGVLTILCNHSFHGSCLQKWEDLCCPVCRYLQTPEPETDSKCLVCGSLEDLWICLICGHVGCGRYTSEHAKQHYMETHHNYAMALIDNRVWDYAGDYFVHRLFQNKEDGKLVEQKNPDGSMEEREAKIEAIQLECMYLLTSQLESQRKYWEEQLDKAQQVADTDRKTSLSQLTEAISKLEYLEKERTTLEKKNQQLAQKYSSSLRELSTEKQLNDGLRKNQDEWKTKVARLEEIKKHQETEIMDLKEQLRDLMFFIEAQKTVQDADEEMREEIQGGQMVVGATGLQRKKRRPKKK